MKREGRKTVLGYKEIRPGQYFKIVTQSSSLKNFANYFEDCPDLKQSVINKDIERSEIKKIIKLYNEWFLSQGK